MIGLPEEVSLQLSPQAHAGRPSRARRGHKDERQTVYIVVDDDRDRHKLSSLIEQDGSKIEGFSTSEEFLERCEKGVSGCLLVDAQLPGMNGLDLLRWVNLAGWSLPAVVMTAPGRVPAAVAAMRAGAADVVEKPVGNSELLGSVRWAMAQCQEWGRHARHRKLATKLLADLTPRQRQVLKMVLAGHPSKNIAADLGISQRTVECHRAVIMRRTSAKTLPALAWLAIMANWYEDFPK